MNQIMPACSFVKIVLFGIVSMTYIEGSYSVYRLSSISSHISEQIQLPRYQQGNTVLPEDPVELYVHLSQWHHVCKLRVLPNVYSPEWLSMALHRHRCRRETPLGTVSIIHSVISVHKSALYRQCSGVQNKLEAVQ